MTVERRRVSVGELYLTASAIAAAAMSGLLGLAPHRLTTSSSLTTVYGLADRSTWAVCFAVLAVVCAAGAWRPTEGRFVLAVTLIVLCQVAWAVGLTMPAFTDGQTANLLAPVAWLHLAVTSLIVVRAGRHTPIGYDECRGSECAPRPFLPRRGRRPSTDG